MMTIDFYDYLVDYTYCRDKSNEYIFDNALKLWKRYRKDFIVFMDQEYGK